MRDDSIALNVHPILLGERNIQKKRSPRQICRGLRDWCGREDSNFHGLSPTATSTLRVYQFRHDRSIYGRRYQIATTHARTAPLTRSALFAARSFGPAHMGPRTRYSDCTRQQAYAHGSVGKGLQSIPRFRYVLGDGYTEVLAQNHHLTPGDEFVVGVDPAIVFGRCVKFDDGAPAHFQELMDGHLRSAKHHGQLNFDVLYGTILELYEEGIHAGFYRLLGNIAATLTQNLVDRQAIPVIRSIPEQRVDRVLAGLFVARVGIRRRIVVGLRHDRIDIRIII